MRLTIKKMNKMEIKGERTGLRGIKSETSCKIFYPGIYFRVGKNPDAPPSAGFPDTSLGKRLAESLKVGDRMIMARGHVLPSWLAWCH